MSTKAVKVRLEVPEQVSEAARATAEREARESAVLSLWQTGELSTREAVAELGITYYDFHDLLADRGIPVADGSFDDDALEQARRGFAERQP